MVTVLNSVFFWLTDGSGHWEQWEGPGGEEGGEPGALLFPALSALVQALPTMVPIPTSQATLLPASFGCYPHLTLLILNPTLSF